MHNSTEKNSNRNSSIELLRIITMVMIILHHFAYHGWFEFDNSIVSIPRMWYILIFMGGKIGVNVFVLISGYFLISKKDYLFNWKHIAKFWGQVFFYCFITTMLFEFGGSQGIIANGISRAKLHTLISAFFPILFSKWWFASTYFVLYLIHPFVNKMLYNLDKKTHQSLILLLIICWSVIPTLTNRSFEGNNLLWFVCLYCIAAYIRLYGLNPKYNHKHYLQLLFIVLFGTYTVSIICALLGTKWPIFSSYTLYFYFQEKLPTLIIAVSLFMTFVTFDMKYNKWINIIASTTFGVFLLHENTYIQKWLWVDVFKNASYQDSNLIIVYSIFVSIVVFVICSLIDYIRQLTVEKIYIAWLNKYLDRIVSLVSRLLSLIKRKIFG